MTVMNLPVALFTVQLVTHYQKSLSLQPVRQKET